MDIKDKATEALEKGKDVASNVADKANDLGHDALEKTKEVGGHAVDKIKEVTGDVINNERLEAEGQADQASGKVQAGLGDAKEAVKDLVDKI